MHLQSAVTARTQRRVTNFPRGSKRKPQSGTVEQRRNVLNNDDLPSLRTYVFFSSTHMQAKSFQSFGTLGRQFEVCRLPFIYVLWLLPVSNRPQSQRRRRRMTVQANKRAAKPLG